MIKVAQIENNSIVQYRYVNSLEDISRVSHKMKLLPVEEVFTDVLNEDEIYDSGNIQILEDKVLITYNKIKVQVNLEEYKNTICSIIDSKAEEARLRYITPGSGQALEYKQNEIDSENYINDYNNNSIKDDSFYPMLKAERDAYLDNGIQVSMLMVAQELINSKNQWLVVGSEIKRRRRTAKIAIENATTKSEIDAAFNSLNFNF
jgi:hypothetical protein